MAVRFSSTEANWPVTPISWRTRWGSVRDVVAEDLAGPAVDREEGGEHLEHGGLAGAVGAEDAEDLAAVDLEVDPVDGALVAELLDEPGRPDGGLLVVVWSWGRACAPPVSPRLRARLRPRNRRMVGSRHAGCPSETRHPGPDRRRPRRGVRRLHRLGRRPGPRALPAPGRGGHRAARRQPRHPRHADRVREVAGRDRRARRRARPGQGELLHRADQGAGEREVLRPHRGLRRRQRRHAHRRRRGQPRRADHLLHRRGAGQHRAARGPRRPTSGWS